MKNERERERELELVIKSCSFSFIRCFSFVALSVVDCSFDLFLLFFVFEVGGKWVRAFFLCIFWELTRWMGWVGAALSLSLCLCLCLGDE